MSQKNFFIITDSLGKGSEELGKQLMKNFIYTLARSEQKPKKIFFMNEGVRLTCEGSPVLEDLQALVDAGVELNSCGTCLDYYELQDSLKVGSRSGMAQIVEDMLSLDDSITIR